MSVEVERETMPDGTELANVRVVQPDAPVEVTDGVSEPDSGPEPESVVAEPEEAPAKPEKNPEYATPQDTVTALRLIRQKKLIEPDDDKDTRNHVKNLVVAWIMSKRAGNTTQEWDEWFTTPDTETEAAETEDDGEEDPT